MRDRDPSRPSLGTASPTPSRMTHSIGTFFFALHVPYASIFGLALAFTAGGIGLPRMLARRPRLFLTTLVLLASLGTYYAGAAHYSFLSPTTAAGYAAVALFGYLVGCARGAVARSVSSTVGLAGLVSAVLGAGLFAFATTLAATPAQLASRIAPSIWTGAPFNAPGLGALASLGMVLLVPAIFARPGDARGRLLLRVVFPVAGLLGVATNLALQNRTPFLATAAALLVGALLTARDRRMSAGSRGLRLGFAAALALVGALLASGWFASTAIGQRFAEEGLKTARYEVWWTVLRGLPEHPWGGRQISIAEPFAHNLWLDMAWDAGIVPAALMLAFHLLHVKPLRALLRTAASDVQLVLTSVGVALLVTSFAEPVTAFPIAYLSLFNYYTGLVMGLGDRGPRR